MQMVRLGRDGDGDGGKGGKGGKGDTPPGGAPPRPRGPARTLLGIALALASSAPLGAAQGFDVLVSLSGDDALPTGPVRDQDLVLHAPGAVAHVAWPSETLQLLCGDGGSGDWPVFTDVDAVHDAGGATADQGLYLSLSSDEAGFKDGDVLRGGSGAFSVWRAEAEFLAAAGATDGNVDLDALQIDADGTVLFSFGDNEASSLLSGDTAGVIGDGDVLRWPAGATAAQMLYTESQVSAMVTQALGSTTTVSTTDTSALARDPSTGEVLFTVQSPTANDATVFSSAGGGSLLEGHAEGDFGFTTAPEIDALSVAASRFPAATVSTGNPPAGGSVSVSLTDAEPGVPHFVLVALGVGPVKPVLEGWGGCVLQQDSLLAVAWSQASALLVVPDGAGAGTFVSSIPAAMAPVDVVLQVVAPPAAGPARGGNPVLLQIAQ